LTPLKTDTFNQRQNELMTVLSSNKLFLWRESVLYIGDSFEPQMHSHHAVQCCIALNGKLNIRWTGVEQWQPCTMAIIGANVPHSISNPDGPLCLLYMEKTSRNYRTIMDSYGVVSENKTRSKPLTLDKPVPKVLRKKLLQALSTDIVSADANDLKKDCLRLFNGYISESKSLDGRIARLLTYLHAQPGQIFTGSDLAQVVTLSESRMQHLFKEQIGVPIRRYILWMRIRHVLDLALAGCSLTLAANQSGFSDSAHFSRTFKSMFGIAPSMLFTSGSSMKALFCERE